MNIELITHIIKQILERENFPTKSLEGIVGVARSSAFIDEELASLIIETNQAFEALTAVVDESIEELENLIREAKELK